METHSKRSGAEFVAYERYDAPKVQRVVTVQENKKLLGKAMGKKTKPVLDYLNALPNAEKLNLQKQLLSEGKIAITVEHEPVELSKDLISFVEKEKIIMDENYIPSFIELSFAIGRIINDLLEYVY